MAGSTGSWGEAFRNFGTGNVADDGLFANVLYNGSFYARYSPTSLFPLISGAASAAQAERYLKRAAWDTGVYLNRAIIHLLDEPELDRLGMYCAWLTIPRTEDDDGVWASAAACMRTSLWRVSPYSISGLPKTFRSRA